MIALYVVFGVFVLPDGPAGDVKRGPLVLVVSLYPLLGSVIARRLRTGESYPTAWRHTVTRRSLLALGAGIVATQAFFTAFMAWKAQLPAWGHFAADPLLADLDATLHGGRDAWRRLGWLVSPLGLKAADRVYHLWLPITCLMLGWRAWMADVRFFLAFAISWIVLGTGVALAWHSAGPIFYQDVTGYSRFAPLVNRLVEAGPLLTLEERAILWDCYAAGLPSSISAFPSMHIATITLYALVCRGSSPRVAYALLVLLGLTLVATVVLGWHYAVDGYVAVLGAWTVWWCSGWLLQCDKRAVSTSRSADESCSRSAATRSQ